MKKIAEGFKNLAFKKKEIETMATARIAECSRCEYNSANSGKSGPARCTACGCVIASKARSPKSSCPKGKWEK